MRRSLMLFGGRSWVRRPSRTVSGRLSGLHTDMAFIHIRQHGMAFWRFQKDTTELIG